jgi:hypothetical protein
MASVTSCSGFVPHPLRNIIHRKFGLIQLMRPMLKPPPPRRPSATAAAPIDGRYAW